MEKFHNLNQFLEVVERFKKTHEKIVSNLTTFAKEMEDVIFEGRLFYSIYPHTLLIFRDEIDYWQTMLMTDGESEKIKLPSSKPYASVGLNALRRKNERDILNEKLTSMGIPLVEIYTSYRSKVSEVYPFAKSVVDNMKEKMESKGYKFLPFNHKYIDDIHALWNKYLKRYNYPKEQWNFEFELKEKSILLLFDMNLDIPKLIATIYFFKKDASYMSTGFAVNTDYRHDMVAVYIEAMHYCMAHDAGINVLNAWIRDDNKRAIKLDEMFGMKKTLLQCKQYYSG